MKPDRAPTPAPVARQLRQESGFGCCKCGHPILQYHHIVPYADDPHFRPSDMMALCPNCHLEATSGALTEERQRYLKEHPFNIVRGCAKGLLTINGTDLRVVMGGNEFVGGGALLLINDQPVISLEMNDCGSLDLSVSLSDEIGKTLLEIHRNEWLSADPLPWDIEARHQVLHVRRKKGSVSLSLDCRNLPIQLHGSFWGAGRLFHIDSKSIIADRTGLRTRFIGGTFERTCINIITHPSPKVKIRPNAYCLRA